MTIAAILIASVNGFEFPWYVWLGVGLELVFVVLPQITLDVLRFLNSRSAVGKS